MPRNITLPDDVNVLPDGKPELPVPETTLQAGIKRAFLDIVVVTPMFGGSPVMDQRMPVANDPVQPVRPASIRGHLRFWWRATRGRKFTTVEKLAQCEAQVWGSTAIPSRTTTTVQMVEQGQKQSCSFISSSQVPPLPKDRDKDVEPLAYALFPFQQDSNRDEARGTIDAKFRLTLEYPEDLKPEVDAALWAWLTFGGIGARTRRGCGALWSSRVLLQKDQVKRVPRWLGAEYRKHCGADAAAGTELKWPTLSPRVLLLKRAFTDPLEAWAVAMEALRHFRQGGGEGRVKQFGKSRWPEAGAIRDAVRKGTPIDDMPRGEFGMPLIFHFKDEPDVDGSELLPPERYIEHDGRTETEKVHRMASPLIVKPLAIGSSRHFVPMIVRLETPELEFARITLADRSEQDVLLRNPERHTSGDTPMRHRSEAGSALEAFWNFAQEKRQFEEVSLTEVGND